MCEAGVESVKLPFESHVFMLVTSLPECVLFLGIYISEEKIEKLINAPVEHFSQQFYMR